MKKTLNSLYYYFSFALIVFLPFQSLLLSVFQDKLLLSPSVSFWLAHWYEPVIILLLILAAIFTVRDAIENYKTSHSVRRITANWSSLLLTLFGLISAVFFSPTLGRGIEGFRFDLLPVLIFILISLQNIPKDKTKILLKTYVAMAIAMAVWAIAERFLPPNYWANLGLSFHGYGYFGFGKFSFGVLNQSASFIGGPNQLGSYLLSAVFIVLYCSNVVRTGIKETSYLTRRILPWLVLIILIAGIFLSFSRSAWVGGIVGLLAYIVFYIKNLKLKFSLTGTLLILLLALFIAYKNIPAVRDIMIHSSADDNGTSSQDSHNEALGQSLKELKGRNATELIFGSGVGMAGPAAIKYSDGIVSESWYIQLLLEMGLIGLALWLVFVGGLLANIYKKNPALFLSLLAVSVTALFLHTWADNPAVAITLMLLIGANYQLSIFNDQSITKLKK